MCASLFFQFVFIIIIIILQLGRTNPCRSLTLICSLLTLSQFVEEIGKQNITELIFRISFWNVTHMLWASYKWFDGKYLPGKVANRLMWWKSERKWKRIREEKWRSKVKNEKQNKNRTKEQEREREKEENEIQLATSEQPEMKNAFRLVSIFNRFIIQFHK